MKKNDQKILIIGSSTGGIPVIEKLLLGIDIKKYSLLIVQHMPEGYTELMASRLNNVTPFNVKEADDFDEIKPGFAYIAPGGKHMLLSRRRELTIRVTEDPPVKRFRPSIELLFCSAQYYNPENVIAVMLTGMCDDGVKSMLKLRELGFITIAQNRESSVVFGMNREAIRMGAAGFVMSPEEIIEYCNGL